MPKNETAAFAEPFPVWSRWNMQQSLFRHETPFFFPLVLSTPYLQHRSGILIFWFHPATPKTIQFPSSHSLHALSPLKMPYLNARQSNQFNTTELMSIHFATILRPHPQQLHQDPTWDQRQANQPIVTTITPLILLYAEAGRPSKKVVRAPCKNLKGIKPVEGRFRHVKHCVKDQAQTEQSLFCISIYKTDLPFPCIIFI